MNIVYTLECNQQQKGLRINFQTHKDTKLLFVTVNSKKTVKNATCPWSAAMLWWVKSGFSVTP